MFNHFNKKQKVIVTGIGKCNSKKYKNNIGYVLCRDPYFHDYNIKFEDNSEDWFDIECIKKYEGG